MLLKDLRAAGTAIKIVSIYLLIVITGIVLVPWLNQNHNVFSVSTINLIKDTFVLFLASIPLFYLIYQSASKQNHHQRLAQINEKRYRSLFDNMSNGVTVYRPIENGQDFVVIDVNNKGLEITNLKHHYCVKRRLSDFPRKVVYKRLLTCMQRVHATGIAEHFPLDRYRNGQLEVSRENYVYRLDSREIVVVYDDVTQKKLLEEQLKQSQKKLTLQNNIITQFLTISDDTVYQPILKFILTYFKSSYGCFGYFDDQDQIIISSLNNTHSKYDAIAVKKVATECTISNDAIRNVILKGTHFIQNKPLTSPVTQIALDNGMAVPIRYQDRTIAVIFLGNKQDPYTSNDVEVLNEISSHIAPILDARLQAQHNARMHTTTLTALQKSEANLKEAEKLAKTGHWEHNIIEDTLFWSDEIYRIFGLDSKHFTPNVENLFARIHPDDRKAVDHAYKNSITEKSPYEITHRIVLDDGTIKHIQERCLTSYNELGKPINSLGTLQDVTKSVLADEANKMLATAIDQSVDVVLVTDKQGLIQYVNPAFEKISEYTKGEILGKNPRFLKSAEHSHAFYKDLWATISNGEVWQGQLVNKSKSGAKFIEETTITPVKDSIGKIINYVAVRHNITRELELEEQLRQAVKMEAVGTLAGGIAHDFNNILGAILGYTRMAMDELSKESQPYQDLCEVIQSGDRAADLVRQILLFSRHQEQEFIPVQIQFLIKETVKMLRASLPASIELQEEIDDTCPPIDADPTQIYQVLMNLGTNARQAMLPEGGTLRITLSQVEFTEESLDIPTTIHPGHYLQLTIQDTGAGIEDETIKRIFDPFFTTKGIGEGTGLGLAVVHGIIKSHHGSISVKSSPQEGTQFSIFLPVDDTIAKVVSSSEDEVLPIGSEHILVVDDEPNILILRERILSKLGYQVTTFNSTITVMESIKEDPFQYDLLLIDMAMPNMSGKDLLANIRKINPDIPAILCTGNAELLTKSQIIQYGFCTMLEKPIKPLILAKTIREFLNEKEQTV